uniref:WAS/WASL interacting protein family member 3 n=1 Tax=Molossus molossus TaxID=27622 RepID=A0A7J8HE61_MOLMO|nr:WAS/WASL interacting protein family member 3 [Molossus molossus]
MFNEKTGNGTWKQRTTCRYLQMLPAQERQIPKVGAHCWLTSSKELACGKSRRSMTAVLRKSRVLKEPTEKEEVPQTLEEGAHPPPWETCLLVAFLCCEQQARGTQQMTSSLNSRSILWKTFLLRMNINHARRFTPARSPEAVHLVPGSTPRLQGRAPMTSKAETLSYL